MPAASFGAFNAALQGILAALYVRGRTGRGQKVATSLVQGLTGYDLYHWLGLLEAMREQARFLAANAASPLELLLDLPPATDVPAAVEVAIYRITSEALTNVIRHAQATTCRIRLHVDGHVELEVADDGVGFTPARDATGIGLESMQDRARELGGSFSVSSQRPRGTRVEVRIPVRS